MKKYNQIILTVLFLVLSIQVNAVYEGRDGSLEQYQSIRTQAELAPMEQRKATDGSNPGGDPGTDPNAPPTGTGPITGSPLFILLLGGLTCGSYILLGRRKLKFK